MVQHFREILSFFVIISAPQRPRWRCRSAHNSYTWRWGLWVLAPCAAQHVTTPTTSILIFRDQKSNHEIYENIVPRKFGAIQYIIIMMTMKNTYKLLWWKGVANRNARDLQRSWPIETRARFTALVALLKLLLKKVISHLPVSVMILASRYDANLIGRRAVGRVYVRGADGGRRPVCSHDQWGGCRLRDTCRAWRWLVARAL